MMRSSNPALKAELFSRERSYGLSGSMTLQGTVNKCFILLGLLVLSAAWVWGKMMQPAPLFESSLGASGVNATSMMMPYVVFGGIAGFILAVVTIFRLPWAKFTAPAYALCEGLVLGGLSAIFEQQFPGIVMQAVSLTFGTLFVMLAIYKSGLIKVTNKFMMGVSSATGAVCLVYFLSWILGFFGIGVPFIHGNGLLSIGFSLLVVGIAALNLILDFHIIEQGVQQGAQKYMEWYGAFTLLVTLVWLYMEILRLLSKLRSRR